MILAEAGMKASFKANAQKAVSITPDIDRPWPVSALVLLIFGFAPELVNTDLRALASDASPAGVDVA